MVKQKRTSAASAPPDIYAKLVEMAFPVFMLKERLFCVCPAPEDRADGMAAAGVEEGQEGRDNVILDAIRGMALIVEEKLKR